MNRREFLVGLTALGAIAAPFPLQGFLASAASEASATPLPAGAKLLFIGDSIFAAATTSYLGDRGDYLSHNAAGEIVWAWMTDPRFRLDIWTTEAGRVEVPAIKDDGANQGIPGTTGYRLNGAKEIARIRELDPDVVVIGFGANDLAMGMPPQYFKRNFTSFCRQMIEVDKRKVVIALIRPHVTSGAAQPKYNYPPEDPRWQTHADLNAWFSGELKATYPGSLEIWDTETPLSDPKADRPGIFLPSATRDGIHLTDYGAYLSAGTLLPILQSMIAPGTFFDTNPAIDNLLPNPSLAGNAGTAGPGASGTIPDKTRIGREIGKVGSVAVEAGPSPGVTLSVGAEPGEDEAQEVRFWLHGDRSLPIEDAGGRFVQLYVPIEVERSAGIVGVTAFLADDSARNRVEGLKSSARDTSNWSERDFKGWLITPALRLPDGAKGVRASVNIRFAADGSRSKIHIGDGAILRYVPAPPV